MRLEDEVKLYDILYDYDWRHDKVFKFKVINIFTYGKETYYTIIDQDPDYPWVSTYTKLELSENYMNEYWYRKDILGIDVDAEECPYLRAEQGYEEEL